MGLKQAFAIGFSTALMLLIGCAGKWPYKPYGLDADSYSGWLRGPNPENDVALELCKPDIHAKGKCYVIFAEDYHRLRTEYLDMQERLKACEKPKLDAGPTPQEFADEGNSRGLSTEVRQ